MTNVSFRDLERNTTPQQFAKIQNEISGSGSANFYVRAGSLDLPGSIGHGFWSVEDEDGNVVAELHGLATSATGQVKAVGWMPDDTIKAYGAWGPVAFSADKIMSDERALIGGSLDAQAMISDCLSTSVAVNNLDLNYPGFGFIGYNTWGKSPTPTQYSVSSASLVAQND